MGRRAHRPDEAGRRQVEALAGYGIPEAEIAGVIGIDAKTLRKHYSHELDHGHTKANARVAENLYRKATGEGRESGQQQRLKPLPRLTQSRRGSLCPLLPQCPWPPLRTKRTVAALVTPGDRSISARPGF